MTTFDGLPSKEYKCIVVDPPWRYGDTLPGERGAEDKYDGTLGIDELRDLPVKDLAEDAAHLWLWYTNAFIREASWLVDMWGFRGKTQLTWCKPQIGMGRYLRNTTEHCILAVKGRLLSIDENRNIPSHFTASRAKVGQSATGLGRLRLRGVRA